jgi:hypothetical protein
MSNELVIGCLERIRERITENILTKGEWASGKTAESMRIEGTENGGRLLGRKYFQSLEDGRPGGKVPYNFKQIISDWIEAKKLNVSPIEYKRDGVHKYTPYQRGLNQMAGAIAWSIKNHGTRLYQTGGRNDIYSDVISEEVERLKKQLIYNTIQTIGKTINAK